MIQAVDDEAVRGVAVVVDEVVDEVVAEAEVEAEAEAEVVAEAVAEVETMTTMTTTKAILPYRHLHSLHPDRSPVA